MTCLQTNCPCLNLPGRGQFKVLIMQITGVTRIYFLLDENIQMGMIYSDLRTRVKRC